MKIALIAHDGKKSDMVAFVMKRLQFFNREDVDIVATGTTGKKLLHAGVTKVETVNSGPMGGDAGNWFNGSKKNHRCGYFF